MDETVTSDRGRLGAFGIFSAAWTNALRGDAPTGVAELRDAAAELEALGYGTLWVGGSAAVRFAEPFLAATARVTVATGIVSMWEYSATDIAAECADFERRYPGRFVLGLGVSHPHRTPGYARPYTAMRDYLSELDHAAQPLPVANRVLAALGPRMLGLAREQAAGAHPYLITEEHTAEAREILGEKALLAPAVNVILDTDADRARATARPYLRIYLGMPNYTNSMLRLGFTEDDFRDGGSDRLVDAMVAHGDADTVAGRLLAFQAAGADHVAIQALTDDTHHDLPMAQWRRLAEILPLG